MDPKNYHSWAHRQALVAAWELWDTELEFARMHIEQDFRNNSAWNQRYFVLTRGWVNAPSNPESESCI